MLHDSGKRQAFGSGAVRDASEGKPEMALISPYALERLGEHYRAGAQKYNPRNWEQGMPFRRTFDSLMRHAVEFMKGGTAEDHLAAVAWNAIALMHFEEMIKMGLLPESLNDMPRYEQCQSSLDYATRVRLDGGNSQSAANAGTIEDEPTDPAADLDIVYIAGPMRGYHRYNFDKFDTARDLFNGQGWKAISPADIDRHEFGGGRLDPLDESEESNREWLAFEAEVDAWTREDVITVVNRDCQAIMLADAIALLPGWEHSTGALAEFFVARWCGIPIYDATTGELMQVQTSFGEAISAIVTKTLTR